MSSYIPTGAAADDSLHKRLIMGKSCLRFRRAEDVPLDVIGETIARADLDRYLAHYEAATGSSRQTREG